MKIIKGLGQRGDTLVEVLICILIVSVILTGAYVTTNKSSLRVMDSQEHAVALKIAQGQLEQIRQNATTASPNVFDRALGNAFCIVGGQIKNSTDVSCKQDQSGAATTAEPAYAITATRLACAGTLPANCSMFSVKIQWQSISTKTQSYEQLSYRLYK
jgi:prepilin-type N-terminal cleavage/methylation domain-containing protein